MKKNIYTILLFPVDFFLNMTSIREAMANRQPTQSEVHSKTVDEVGEVLSNAVYLVNKMEVAPIKVHHLVVSCLIDAGHELKVIQELSASKSNVDFVRMFQKLHRLLQDAREYMTPFQEVYGTYFDDVTKCVAKIQGVRDWLEAVGTPL